MTECKNEDSACSVCTNSWKFTKVILVYGEFPPKGFLNDFCCFVEEERSSIVSKSFPCSQDIWERTSGERGKARKFQKK